MPCLTDASVRSDPRAASGMFAQRVEWVGYHSFGAVCPDPPPIWIPAFAGMTGVSQRSPRASVHETA